MSRIRFFLCCLSLILLMAPFASAFSIGIPGAEKMVSDADVIVVANWKERDGKLYVKPARLLKGTLDRSREYEIRSRYPENIFSYSELREILKKGGEFIFIGKADLESHTVDPIYLLFSFWAHGSVYAPRRNVPLCEAFAKEQLRRDAISDMRAPPAKEMVEKSDIIAEGEILERDGKILLKIEKVLKGRIIAGNEYEIRVPDFGGAFRSTDVRRLFSGELLILLGGFETKSSTLVATYGPASFWPHRSPKDMPAVNVRGSMEFIKKCMEPQ